MDRQTLLSWLHAPLCLRVYMICLCIRVWETCVFLSGKCFYRRVSFEVQKFAADSQLKSLEISDSP